MKKKLFLMGILVSTAVFGMLVVGCNNDSQTSSNPTGDGEKAAVIFNLPDQNSRNIDTAMADTNFYEVMLYKRAESGEGYTDHYNGSAAASAGSITLYVTEGTYDILMLAGNYTPSEDLPADFQLVIPDAPDIHEGWSCGDALPVRILLASGYIKGKPIVMGTNTVDMPLNSIDYTVNIPSDLRIGQRYNGSIVSLNITFRNEFLEKYPRINCGMMTSRTRISLIHAYGDIESTVAGEWGKDEEGRWVKNPGAADADKNALVKNGQLMFIGPWTSRYTPTTPGTEDVIGVCFLDYGVDAMDSPYMWYLFNSFNTQYTGAMPTQITFADTPKVEFNVSWGGE
ncbi:MAG: hypothetical protein LBH75_04695 [Treponema sp.]|nr:hypothetical protein [Treponema sp.]